MPWSVLHCVNSIVDIHKPYSELKTHTCNPKLTLSQQCFSHPPNKTPMDPGSILMVFRGAGTPGEMDWGLLYVELN